MVCSSLHESHGIYWSTNGKKWSGVCVPINAATNGNFNRQYCIMNVISVNLGASVVSSFRLLEVFETVSCFIFVHFKSSGKAKIVIL